MGNSVVRIESIEISNFKNVRHGYLNFRNPKKNYAASILGLYGQNGSGKTALIDSFELLKLILSGQPIPHYFSDYINVDSEIASIKYELNVENPEEHDGFSVIYKASIRRDINDFNNNTAQQIDANVEGATYRTTLFDESLSCSYKHGTKRGRLSPFIDTQTDGTFVFLPRTKYNELVGKDKKTPPMLAASKQIALNTSRSFIFSKELLDVIRKNCKNDQYKFLMEGLVSFGNFELFVINTQNTGLISLNALPLAFNYSEAGKAAVGNMLISLDHPTVVPQQALSVVHRIIESMNIVLPQLIPGLAIDVQDLGTQLNANSIPCHRIQLISKKNSREIPLQYESEGIKKIISILQLLIVIYNRASMTVAIDELDSGIFEYLLGEILRILSEQGKGQLIFTSHNLRPLETIDKGFVAFTTTNPDNRYLRMSNVKTSNNLRDFYYRDIILGEQSEQLYEPTNNSEIALAFREAGIRNAT